MTDVLTGEEQGFDRQVFERVKKDAGRGEYVSVTTKPEVGDKMMDALASELSMTHQVLRVDIREDGEDMAQVVDDLAQLKPDVAEKAIAEFLTTTAKLTTLMKRVARESDRPVVAIINHMERVPEGDDRDSMIMGIQSLANARGLNEDAAKLAFVLVSDRKINDLISPKEDDSYDVGTRYVVE